jgi:hypothetical protein
MAVCMFFFFGVGLTSTSRGRAVKDLQCWRIVTSECKKLFDLKYRTRVVLNWQTRTISNLFVDRPSTVQRVETLSSVLMIEAFGPIQNQILIEIAMIYGTIAFQGIVRIKIWIDTQIKTDGLVYT